MDPPTHRARSGVVPQSTSEDAPVTPGHTQDGSVTTSRAPAPGTVPPSVPGASSVPSETPLQTSSGGSGSDVTTASKSQLQSSVSVDEAEADMTSSPLVSTVGLAPPVFK